MRRPKLKKASKRMTCRLKFKIDKKVREHNRKKRKEAKKNNNNNKQAKRRDPGVPNIAPFKEEVLREAERRKQKLEEEKERQKEERRKMINKRRELKLSGDLQTFQKDVMKRQRDFERKNATLKKMDASEHLGLTENSRRAYYKEFKKVVESSDVVLEVLDARDPLGCRCSEVEQTIMSSGSNKRVVLVLNKIDLVPKENVEAWLKYLRNDFPTVAFKASTQSQKHNLSQNRAPIRELNKDLLSKTSKCLGVDNLLKLLGNYCRNVDIKTSITVGVVGFPNVGKSSLINSLKRSKACNVGATPGVTKSVQPVTIDKNIKILDCPGIVMATGNNESAVILRNCVKVETIEDPTIPVDAILKRCNKEQIMMHYNVSNYDDTSEFLSLLARRQGRLKKGGVPNVCKAARSVLNDWNNGRISYFTHPPEVQATHISAEIVTRMAKEFDWNSLENDNLETLDAVRGAPSISGGVVFQSMGPSEMETEDEKKEDACKDSEKDSMDEEEMEESEIKMGKITIETRSKTKGSNQQVDNIAPDQKSAIRFVPTKQTVEMTGSNVQANKNLKEMMKKNKKKKKRADALSDKLGEDLLSAMDFSKPSDEVGDDDDNYDFDTDFKMK